MDDRLYHGLLLRAPQRSPSGLYEACTIRTPVVRFEMRRVRGRFTRHFTLKQNWTSDKGQPVPFPVKPDESLKTHLVLLLEAMWTYHVFPELRKRRIAQAALFAVQVLYPGGQQPVVRLDGEVRVRATILERREGWPSEHRLVLRANPRVVRQSPRRRVIDMELLDDERTRYGHFTCLRVDGYWWGIIDFVGLLPQSVQDAIEAWEHCSLSRGIILSAYGDDSAKDQLLRQLGVDTSSLSELLKEGALNLAYASVFRSYEDTPIQQLPGIINHRITEEISREKESYTWEGVEKHVANFSELSREQINEQKEYAENIFATAKLTEPQRRVMELEVILGWHEVKWTQGEKAQYLGMKEGSYRKHLYDARIKTQSVLYIPQKHNGYERLLWAILGGTLDKKVT